MAIELQGLMSATLPKRTKKRSRPSASKAPAAQEEAQKLIDMDEVIAKPAAHRNVGHRLHRRD